MAATAIAGAAAPSLPKAEEHMDPRRLIAFFAMVVGMFMAILDIQIVSASLAEIQAGLSAGSDEIGWVQTSYLIAEVIMIPLSGTLARIVSTRVLFSVAAAGFTAASALAATATNIEQMIAYRAIQGFIGGGMIPSVFAAAFTIFPPSKRNVVSPIIGLIATLARPSARRSAAISAMPSPGTGCFSSTSSPASSSRRLPGSSSTSTSRNSD